MGTFAWHRSLPALLGVLLAAYSLHLLIKANVFKTLTPISLNCEKVVLGGLGGGEDITIDKELGLAFISSGNLFRPGITGIPGGIYTLNLSLPHSAAVRLPLLHYPSALLFNPHGIGLLSLPTHKYLFVVTHDDLTHRHYVSKFEYTQKGGTPRLIHLESYNSSQWMQSPNDVVPIGLDQFYVTNDHGKISRIGQLMEEFGSDFFAGGDVTGYDAESNPEHPWSVVVPGLKFPNGVNVNALQNRVFVAECLGKRLLVFERENKASMGPLKLIQSIELEMTVDNIEVEDEEHVWIGGHPKPLSFLWHARDPTGSRSPSQVVRVNWKTGQVRDVYVDLGDQMSASSVAALWTPPGQTKKKELIIGSVYEPFVLRCDVSSLFASPKK